MAKSKNKQKSQNKGSKDKMTNQAGSAASSKNSTGKGMDQTERRDGPSGE